LVAVFLQEARNINRATLKAGWPKILINSHQEVQHVYLQTVVSVS
jgi:hypothetical protein